MSLFVCRISRPQSDAGLVCRFAHQLAVRSRVTVGARRSTTVPGQWQIVWNDGPTVLAMRRHAAELGRALVGIDLDHLTWQRTTRTAPTDAPEVVTPINDPSRRVITLDLPEQPPAEQPLVATESAAI